MNERRVVVRCCICGRDKLEGGWQYPAVADDGESEYTHGFCPVCYETELMKIRLRSVVPAALAACR